MKEESKMCNLPINLHDDGSRQVIVIPEKEQLSKQKNTEVTCIAASRLVLHNH
jgi:hypothetical protein